MKAKATRKEDPRRRRASQKDMAEQAARATELDPTSLDAILVEADTDKLTAPPMEEKEAREEEKEVTGPLKSNHGTDRTRERALAG